MRSRRTATALVLGLALALTGCGKAEEPSKKDPSSAPTSPSAPPVEPATGPALKGTGYTFHLPQGWVQRTLEYKRAEKELEVAGGTAPDATGIANAVKVRITDAKVDEPDAAQLEEISKTVTKELKTLIPQLVVNEPTEIDGQPALDHEGPAARGGQQYYIHQYIAFKDGKAYAITFQFSRVVTGTQRTAIVAPVLASWTWS